MIIHERRHEGEPLCWVVRGYQMDGGYKVMSYRAKTPLWTGSSRTEAISECDRIARVITMGGS